MAVHDGDACVRRAVESLRAQTLQNFEPVVVDAGSTDATPRILQSLSERDLRVRVLTTGEVSRGTALQLALERSHGTYLLVMDADAWAEPTLLAELVTAAQLGDLELVIGGFSLVLMDGGKAVGETDVLAPTTTYPTQHDFRAAAWQLLGSGQLLPASGKLFVRERAATWGACFDDARPAGAGAGSDHGFVVDYLARVERVGVLGETRYHVERSASPAVGGLEGFRQLDAEHTQLLALYKQWGFDGDAASVQMLQTRYAERLAGCVEGVCSREEGISASERDQAVAQMIGTDRAQLAASVAKPSGGLAKVLMPAIRARNAKLACLPARIASLLPRALWAEGTVAPDAFV